MSTETTDPLGVLLTHLQDLAAGTPRITAQEAEGCRDPRLGRALAALYKLRGDIEDLEGLRRQLGEANTFVEAIIENIPDMIFVKEASELRFVRFNRAGERLLGRARQDLIGRNDYDFFPPGEADHFTSMDRSVLDRGETRDILEEPIHTASGLRWLHTKKVRILGTDGQPRYLLGISEDITDRKLAREALRESERRFQTLANSSPVGILEIDAGGGCIYTNPRWSEISGLSAEASLGQGWAQALHPEDRERVLEAWTRTMAHPDRLHLEFRLTRPDGATPWVLGLVTPEWTDSGAVSRFVGTFTDTTDLQEARREAEAANKDLEAFAYSVSHDLRAPLRHISGFSRILMDSYSRVLDEAGQDYLARINAGSERLGMLIDELLTLSRLTRAEMTREPVDLSRLTADILVEIRQTAPERNVQTLVQPDLVVQGDKTLLRALMYNLLDNAWKFSGPRESGRISFGAIEQAGHRTFFVQDNGVGFDMAQADRLFRTFQRLHRASEFPGTGIGLVSAQRAVGRHGGRIWAESKPDQGATFFFTLPGSAHLRSSE